jgi:hypothetical protein
MSVTLNRAGLSRDANPPLEIIDFAGTPGARS